jgi:hypothetical protein
MKRRLSKIPSLGFIVAVSCLGTGQSRADISEGLLAHYPLDGSGEDTSGQGHNGVVQSATPTANRFNEAGKALLFDGVNSFIAVPDSPALRLSGTDFTISAWVLETERGGHFSDCIISKRGPTGPGLGRPGDGRGWILSLRGLHDTNTTGRLFYHVSGGEDPRAVSSRVLELNQWHQVAVVYHAAAESVEIFLDGAWDSTTANVPTPNPANTQKMHIGNDSQRAYNNAYVFHGKIGDVRIYGRALAVDDINSLYGTGLFLNGTQFTGDAMMRMYGGLTVGQKVVVESSPDLTHWTPIETNIVQRSSLCVTNFIDHSAHSGFFRVSVP